MTSPSPPKSSEPTVDCAGGCKATWPAKTILESGWDFLPISGRYRCQNCWRELQAVNKPAS